MEKIKVGITGAYGKMGQEVIKAVSKEDNMTIVFVVDPLHAGESMIIGTETFTVFADVATALEAQTTDVVVDFTNADALRTTAPAVLSRGVHLVTGTTGLDPADWQSFGELATVNNTSIFYASNFAIGAVLMMMFAEQAARYMPHVEVIEMHHDQKKDAPSGTAISTLQRIAKGREAFEQGYPGEIEKIPGSRGGNYEGMHVHSVRMPGYNAHQEVIFGGLGQTLTIRHDSINRESFMPGVVLAINKTYQSVGLLQDLESIMA